MKLKNILFGAFGALIFYGLSAPQVFAADDITAFTSNTLNLVFVLASAVSVIFITKGGYQYMTSSGNPQGLDSAKKTIRNAVIGLLLILSATTISQLLQGSINPSTNSATQQIVIPNIKEVQPAAGVSQVLTDAITGTLQTMIQSATAPVINGIIGFLTSTPQIIQNQVIVKFWLVSVGIADTLFVLVIALLGLQIMSTSSLGFEETSLSKIAPRLVIAFLGIHCSIFLMDLVISLCNALTTTLLSVTGGLDQSWVLNAFSTNSILGGTQSMSLFTLLFLMFFLILCVVLLLMYITRLITIALAVVLSPFVILLWAMPKFSDFAEVTIKGYVVTVMIVFVHLVIIQLASAMISVPGEKISDNPFLAVMIGIGLFFMLLKTPHLMLQLVMYTKGTSIVKTIGHQVMNVITSKNSDSSETNGKLGKGDFARA